MLISLAILSIRPICDSRDGEGSQWINDGRRLKADADAGLV